MDGRLIRMLLLLLRNLGAERVNLNEHEEKKQGKAR
jgi:hypothetical protein